MAAPPSSRLQKMLQAAVQSVQWTYSLFWQICPQQGYNLFFLHHVHLLFFSMKNCAVLMDPTVFFFKYLNMIRWILQWSNQNKKNSATNGSQYRRSIFTKKPTTPRTLRLVVFRRHQPTGSTTVCRVVPGRFNGIRMVLSNVCLLLFSPWCRVNFLFPFPPIDFCYINLLIPFNITVKICN